MWKDNILNWLNTLFASDKVVDIDGQKSVTLDTLTDSIDSGLVLFDDPEPPKPEDNTILTGGWVFTEDLYNNLLSRLTALENAIEITDDIIDEPEIIEI